MLSASIERSLPYSAEQLFDIAADIERYPEFLRWWISATVLERQGESVRAHNRVALGPLSLQFDSEAMLHRAESIEVRSAEGPLREFALRWQFEPLQPEGCQVTLRVQLRMQSSLLDRLIAPVLQRLTGEVIQAFEQRAQELYPGVPS